MKIINIVLNGLYTDGFSYHENLLPKYHKINGNEVYIIASEYIFNSNGQPEKVLNQAHYIDNNGINIYRLPIRRNKDITYKLKRFIGLYKLIDSIKPDIIFCHLFQFLDVLQVVKYKKLHPEIKLYIDSHADYSNSAKTFISKYFLHGIIWRYCAHRALPYAEKFYGVLPARVDFLIERYKLPKEKCELLEMGADDELVKLSKTTNAHCLIRQKYNIAATDFLIVTGGKIDLAKTQTLLLMKAVREMNNPKVKLIVFGSVVDELKQQVHELSDGNIIQYIGWISSADSYNYFEASDLVIFPGRHSVFWEQVVGQGKPMVVKYWGGTTHIDLGGNVKYLYNDSVSEIKDVIIETMNPITYDKMKTVAEEKGITHFSYKEIAKRSIIC